MLGQEHIIAALREAAGKGTLHHAYLFVGPAGSGKRELAVWLAQLSNCTSDGERPCGVCPECYLIAAGSHPDVTVVGPSEKSKKGQILIEQAQAVRTEVSRIPVLGRRKVIILDPADEMTLDATNCLLKTFEEPPAYATLILLVEDTARVIPTVLSRCQTARFKPAASSTIAAWLVRDGVDPAQAEHVARLCGGRPGEARRLLADASALPKRDRALTWLEAVAHAAQPDALRLAEDLRSGTDDDGADVVDSLRWAGAWFRDIAVLQSGADESLVLNADRLLSLSEAAGVYSRSQALAAADSIVRSRRYLAGNGNATLVTEGLLMDLIPLRDAR